MHKTLLVGVLVVGVCAAAAASRRTEPPAAVDGRRVEADIAPVSHDEPTVSAVLVEFPQPTLANVTDAYEPVRLWPTSEAVQAARAALEEPFTEQATFTETPLRQVVKAVADASGARISLDEEALDAMGFDPDTPITAALAGLSFRAGLRHVLAGLDLRLLFTNDRVLITTADKAAGVRETVFYPVLPGVNLDEVAALLEQTVAPESWSHAGGTGTIVTAPPGMGHGLVVAHDGEMQEQIDSILRHLDAAVWVPSQQDEDVAPLFVRTYEVADADLRAALQERLADLCNDALPNGADPDAVVEVIGRSIVVRSRSRPFHVMAAQIIAALVGERIEVEIDADHGTRGSPAANDT